MTLKDMPRLIEMINDWNQNVEILVLFQPNRSHKDFAIMLEHMCLSITTPWLGVKDHSVQEAFYNLKESFEDVIELREL